VVAFVVEVVVAVVVAFVVAFVVVVVVVVAFAFVVVVVVVVVVPRSRFVLPPSTATAYAPSSPTSRPICGRQSRTLAASSWPAYARRSPR
jgi:hypothetical protein